MIRGMSHRPLGLLLVLNGRHEEAVILLERALDNARESRADLMNEAEYLAFLAEAHLAGGNLVAACQEGHGASEGIRKALNDADALYDKTGARNFKALVHLDRAELAGLEGDAGTRKRELEAALGLFREMKAPIRVREVEQLLVDLG
jgi:hypothetical protein